MARPGRKSKPGKRDKSGRRLKSAQECGGPDRGTEFVAAMRVRFGVHATTALGRAYAAGLLDDPVDDKRAADRLQNAARYRQVQGRIFGDASCGRNPLDTSPRGGVSVVQDMTDRDVAAREWYRQNALRVDATACGSFLDQLTSSAYTDAGPPWLDRLLGVAARDRHPADLAVLECAVAAIDAIGPVVQARADDRRAAA